MARRIPARARRKNIKPSFNQSTKRFMLAFVIVVCGVCLFRDWELNDHGGEDFSGEDDNYISGNEISENEICKNVMHQLLPYFEASEKAGEISHESKKIVENYFYMNCLDEDRTDLVEIFTNDNGNQAKDVCQKIGKSSKAESRLVADGEVNDEDVDAYVKFNAAYRVHFALAIVYYANAKPTPYSLLFHMNTANAIDRFLTAMWYFDKESINKVIDHAYANRNNVKYTDFSLRESFPYFRSRAEDGYARNLIATDFRIKHNLVANKTTSEGVAFKDFVILLHAIRQYVYYHALGASNEKDFLKPGECIDVLVNSKRSAIYDSCEQKSIDLAALLDPILWSLNLHGGKFKEVVGMLELEAPFKTDKALLNMDIREASIFIKKISDLNRVEEDFEDVAVPTP